MHEEVCRTRAVAVGYFRHILGVPLGLCGGSGAEKCLLSATEWLSSEALAVATVASEAVEAGEAHPHLYT
jgi:hypothetical protein